MENLDDWKRGRDDPSLADRIAVSRGLLSRFLGTENYHDALLDKGGAFPQDLKIPESDRAFVVANFNLD